MQTFTLGDKVRMKFGSPPMTVVRVIGESKEDRFVFIESRGYEVGDVICEWFDGNKWKSEIFKNTSLELIQ
ncbi:MAG: DUF2158 domain-containing protein [Dysgonamonadaceae bacterium]|jgi:uncharacterized protein YodC (DUF2158 family)|nr:DUF2158 domain-containing protein [Dysgonamonadaceae bacterium]